jgi:hypothetical protein
MGDPGLRRSQKRQDISGVIWYNEQKGQAMREQMQTRLEMLRKELERGQVELQRVESQRTYLREMVLRISGAIQVLEELLAA